MSIMKKSSSLGFIASMLLSLFTGNAAAALNLAQTPLFLSDQVPPNVMVMLDNSGSMTKRMYEGTTFDPSTNADGEYRYTGVFNNAKNYEYDFTIPVHTTAYTTGYYVPVDPNAIGAFVESSCSLPADAATGCWSGNFLNWVSARRIDASRDVLIGGKLESRTPFTSPSYGTDLNGNTMKYKIVANNEPSDRDFTISNSDSSNYSPIPDDKLFSISSPARGGNYKSIYDPYAKLSAQINSPLYNSASDIIGEFSTIRLKEAYVTVNLNKSYVDPIIISTTPTHDGAQSAVVRINNVTPNSFQVKVQEWDYLDVTHANENLSFIVIEKGEHDLVGGVKIKAGKTNTDAEYVDGNCGSVRTNSIPVTFASVSPSASAFTSTPIVISSAMTENDAGTINTRVWNIDTNGFTLALQEEESPDASGHSIETVGYIAISPGTSNDTTHNVKLEAGTLSNVNHTTKTLNYSSTFSSTPSFIAAMQTMNEGDSAALRLNSNNSSSAIIHVEEEQSCNSEVTHADENVGFIALDGPKGSYNLALAVANEPTGTLHEVNDDVRMGISFYRYDPDATPNIYEDSVIHGGTLRFKIPKNPFIKKPTETDITKLPTDQQGYRPVLEGYIGKPIETIVDAVEHYPMIWGTTPIAENLWEVIQYFEQDNPYYDATFPLPTPFADFVLGDVNSADADVRARDPYYVPAYGEILSCVDSKVLIVTDGAPFKDAAIPNSGVELLQNYDDISNANDVSDLVNANAQGKDNLDDVAYWAFCNKSGSNRCGKSASGVTPETKSTIVNEDTGAPWSNLRDLRTDTGMDGNQYLTIDTIGFAGGSIRPILQSTADNAAGTAYAAAGGAELKDALARSFKQTLEKSSAASVAANSTRLDSTTLIYQASFDSRDWTGQLQAFAIASDGTIVTTADWDTRTTPTLFTDHATRKIYTYDPTITLDPTGTPPVTTKGIEYKWANLSAAQKLSYRDGAETTDTEAQRRVEFIRGDKDHEVQNQKPLDLANFSGTLRNRSTVMGDIINSNPWFVGNSNFGYSSLPEGDSGVYATFLSNNSSRRDMLYVGANDGMLHAFDATDGDEIFAYIPSEFISELKVLTDPDYGKNIAHQYFVDGVPRAGDVFINSDWHTVLVGTTGAGGQSIFALDVTDPDNFDTDKVMWEFTHAELGETIPEPTIARMANGQWAAIIGNGYNSTSGTARLFIINIEDGSLIEEIDTEMGGDNGLGTPVPVDIDGDRIVDVIYAGDLLGNLWKFDVTDDTITSNWDSAFRANPAPKEPIPLFVARDAASPANRQPITAKPQVGAHPDGGVMIYFGTGKYFEVGDNIVGATPRIHTYYGIRDDLTDSAAIGDRDDLQVQKIEAEVTASFNGEPFNLRVTSDNTVDYTDKKGWYMDLITPVDVTKGERVISPSLLRGDRIVFTTLVPSEDPCAAGGTSWLMELDGPTGSRLEQTPFDLDGNGLFDTSDYVTVTIIIDGVSTTITVPVSGKQSKVGITKTPSVIIAGDKEFKFGSGSDGGLERTVESTDLGTGRQSWRQLR